MPETWLSESDIEANEPFGDDYGEDDFALSEDYSGEAIELAEGRGRNRSKDRARARRRAELRQSRAQRSRPAYAPAPPSTPSTPSTPTAIQSAVRTQGLAIKVQEDAFSTALTKQTKRIDDVGLAVALNALEREAEAAFPGLVSNNLVATGLRAATVLPLPPSSRGGYWKDTRTLTVVGIGLLGFFGDRNQKGKEAHDLRIIRSVPQIPPGIPVTFVAEVRDANGRAIADKANTITWTSSNPGTIAVDARGVVTATSSSAGMFATITATGETPQLTDQVLVQVTPAASSGQG
jgi:hypothetical protein